METAAFGKAKTTVVGSSVGSAATYVAGLSIIVAGYFGLTELARLLPAMNPAATPLWPPTGFALALVLLGGYRIWPAILAGPLSLYLISDRSPLECGSVAFATVLAALAGTWLIVRYSNGRETFDTPSGVAKFTIIAFAPTAMIGSSIVLAGLIVAETLDHSDALATWSTLWLADAAATVVIAPVLVLWAMTFFGKSSKRSLLETVAISILATIIGIIAYTPLIGSNLISEHLNVVLPHRSFFGFLVFVPLMWAVFRGNRPGVAT